jgi:hypothetical protein
VCVCGSISPTITPTHTPIPITTKALINTKFKDGHSFLVHCTQHPKLVKHLPYRLRESELVVIYILPSLLSLPRKYFLFSLKRHIFISHTTHVYNTQHTCMQRTHTQHSKNTRIQHTRAQHAYHTTILFLVCSNFSF